MVELNNGIISVSISEKGAEIHSIKDSKGLEFIWQGEQGDWSDHAPTLFPVVGRLRDKTYTYMGKEYSLPIHGFAPKAIFEAKKISDSEALFTICDSEETRANYPFAFKFSVEYNLVGNSLKVKYITENTGDSVMYFSVGAHPGFNLPITKGSDAKKYFLEFDEEHVPTAVGVTDKGFINTEREPFALINDKILPLYPREIFIPTVFLENTSKGVTLKSSNTMHSVHVRFDDFKYLAIWCNKSDSGYICIEPWTGTPDLEGSSKEFNEKFALTSLNAGESKAYSLTISVK